MLSSIVDQQSLLGWQCFIASVLLGTPLLPFKWKSIVLGSVDDLLARLSSLKISSFCEGGDGDVFNVYCDVMRDRYAARDMDMSDIVLSEQWHVSGGIQYCKASFVSPIFDHLPQHEKVARVNIEIVCPKGLDLDMVIAQNKPIAIHLPATGDEGFSIRRTFFAQPLAEEHGITSIIVQLPFYGHRRLPHQDTFALLKLEYMPLQSLAAVMEANAIAKWLVEIKKYQGKFTFTGVSFGGSMSALASIYNSYSHAVVSHVPANSPSDAYVDGALSHSVDFSIFPHGIPWVKQLLDIMDIGKLAYDFDVARLAEEAEIETQREAGLIVDPTKLPKRCRKVYFQLTAANDHYIPLTGARRLFNGMKACSQVEHAHLEYVSGGHVTAFVIHRKLYIDTIAKAIDLL